MHDSSLTAAEADAQDIVKACAAQADNMVNGLSHNGTIRIELAGPPRGKGRARASTRNGHVMMHTDARTSSYEACLRHEAALAMAGRKPLEGPLRLEAHVCLPIPASWSKKRQAQAAAGLIRPTSRSAADLDNIIKSVDALNQVVWVDDSQVVSIVAAKVYSAAPKLVLVVEPAHTTAEQAGVGRAGRKAA